MSMIANDRFPDVPMATQGTNDWHDESLGGEVVTVDNIPGGQNLMTVGDDGGFEWQRARPNGTGGSHQTNYRVPNNTIARQG